MNYYDMRTDRNKGISPLSLRPANPLGIHIDKHGTNKLNTKNILHTHHTHTDTHTDTHTHTNSHTDTHISKNTQTFFCMVCKRSNMKNAAFLREKERDRETERDSFERDSLR